MNRIPAWTTTWLLIVLPLRSVTDGASAQEPTAAQQGSKEGPGVGCGFHATLFALDYFHLEYTAANVSTGLRASNEGTSLADIQETLRAFGLEVTARQGVTLTELVKALNKDTVAILPLPGGNRLNHFFVAALDNDGSPVLANVPYRVSPLFGDVLDRRLREVGGVVLVVHRMGKQTGAMSDLVRVSPSQLDLGEFMVSGPRAPTQLDATLSLFNASQFPIMVSRIQTSCGCTRPDWEGGLLRPAERRQLRVAVSTGGWGRGAAEKALLLTFGDRSKLVVSVHGVGVAPAEKERLEVSQDSFDIDLSGRPIKDPIEVRVTRIDTIGIPLGSVLVAGGPPWLTARVVPTDKETGELWVKVDVGRVIPELQRSSNRVSGTVALSTRSNETLARVQVNVFRRDAFRLSQSVVRIRRGETSTVSVLPTREGGRLKVRNVQSEYSGLSVQTKEEGKGIILAVAIGTDAIKPGYYLVKCTIDSSTGNGGIATLVVQVVPEG